MKHVHTFLTFAAIASLALSPLALGGEVKKTPLKLEEAVQLLEEQKADFETVKNTEAGRNRGGGLVGLALAAAAVYFLYENFDEDEAKERLGL